MERRQTGWIWKDSTTERTKQAARIITGTEINNMLGGYLLKKGSIPANDLEKAGVLYLWFDPVYEEAPVYKVGDWVTVLSLTAWGWMDCRDERTFQIIAEPTEYASGLRYTVADGKGKYCGGLHTDDYRLATENEIKEANNPKEKTIKMTLSQWIEIYNKLN